MPARQRLADRTAAGRCPELAERLLRGLGFAPISETLRMYRGAQPEVSLADVYGLAWLELG
jgi:ribosomal-protein-alanine N-acetyltransferase